MISIIEILMRYEAAACAVGIACVDRHLTFCEADEARKRLKSEANEMKMLPRRIPAIQSKSVSC
ncbi:MAG TPA: hypothetical protein PLT05_00905 [bacterium]|nr:hypothetical protein [Myxococcales bacterium]HQG12912.1 hypothetical protein [bacterium]HQH80069.1 hypothetical protein [bacterium]